jgi:hypothetical protein
MKKGIVLAAALIFLLIPVVLFAQHSGTAAMLCKEKLELSDDQCKKLMDLRTELQMVSIKLEADLKVLELKLCKELSKDDPSASELKTLVSQIGDARAELQQNWIDHLLQAKPIFEPEQWKIFRKCFGEMGGSCATRMDCSTGMNCSPGMGCATQMDCSSGMGCSTGMSCSPGKGCSSQMGCSPKRIMVSGAGQCGPVKCISIEKNCASMSCDNTECSSHHKLLMVGEEDCAPGKSSCKETERRCIKIKAEE